DGSRSSPARAARRQRDTQRPRDPQRSPGFRRHAGSGGDLPRIPRGRLHARRLPRPLPQRAPGAGHRFPAAGDQRAPRQSRV
ncbi:MAG: hypothetical protein AVDCRST_MAG68-5244, partial [uncultured Gemmatimonadetes bacterium]